MRVSRKRAEENRLKIIDTAGRLFRERGFDGVGIKELTRSAGLTSGAFYGQFASKECLTVLASKSALTEGVQALVDAVEMGCDDPLAQIVSGYLCQEHRDNAKEGCAFAALGADATRHSAQLQRSFESALRTHFDVIDLAIEASTVSKDGLDAAAVFSTMVGALVLSRVVEDPDLSTRILESATASLVGRISHPADATEVAEAM